MSFLNPYKETKLDVSLTSVGGALMGVGLIIALVAGLLFLWGLPADAISLKKSPSQVLRDEVMVSREQIHEEVFRKAFGRARVAYLAGGIVLLGAGMIAIGHGGRIYRLAALVLSTATVAAAWQGSLVLASLAHRLSAAPPLVIQSRVEDFTDATGAPLRMEPTADWGAVIRSAGPDGAFETADDVILGEKSFRTRRAAPPAETPPAPAGPLRVRTEAAP